MNATRNPGTVGELAAEHPAAVRALQRNGIDWCCNQQPLEQACDESGVSVEELLEEVRQDERAGPPEPIDWESRPIEELIEHILAKYHRPLDQELPRLEGLVRKVVYTYGPKDPDRVANLFRTFQSLREELERHMTREEQTLFPWILGGRDPGAGQRVHTMMLEHQSMGWLLQRLRALAAEIPAENGDRAAWKALWEGLEALETGLEEHTRLEHEILFPKALRNL